jgi:hypothetical protein
MSSQVFSERVINATRKYIAERAAVHPEIAAFVKGLNGLPLYVDWGGGIALRSDGELISFLWDEPQSIKIATDPHLRFLGLVVGSRSYDELSSLAPIRTREDRDCPLCEGTGRLQKLEEAGVDLANIQCYCAGTGWLPGNVPDPSQG